MSPPEFRRSSARDRGDDPPRRAASSVGATASPRSQATASSGSNGTVPRQRQIPRSIVASTRRTAARTVVAAGAVVAAHVLDVAEHAVRRLGAAPRSTRDTTPRDTSDGIVTRTKRRRRAEELGVLGRPLGSGRQVDEQEVERAPADPGEQVAERRELARRAPHVGVAARDAVEIERLRFGHERAHRDDADPARASSAGRGRARRERRDVARTPPRRACVGPFRSASRIATARPAGDERLARAAW